MIGGRGAHTRVHCVVDVCRERDTVVDNGNVIFSVPLPGSSMRVN